MFHKLLSIKTIARLISIIGILTTLALITQTNIDLYDDSITESTQLSVTQPDKDGHRDLNDTIIDITPRSTHWYSTDIALQHNDAIYQEPTLLLHLRPPLQNFALA